MSGSHDARPSSTHDGLFGPRLQAPSHRRKLHTCTRVEHRICKAKHTPPHYAMAAAQLNTIESPQQTKWQALYTWHSHCTAAKTKLFKHRSEFQSALLHTKSINAELEIIYTLSAEMVSHAVKMHSLHQILGFRLLAWPFYRL